MPGECHADQMASEMADLGKRVDDHAARITALETNRERDWMLLDELKAAIHELRDAVQEIRVALAAGRGGAQVALWIAGTIVAGSGWVMLVWQWARAH